MTICPSTFSDYSRVITCALPLGHEGRHRSSNTDWLWWHGNGETCRTCAHLTWTEPTHESEPA